MKKLFSLIIVAAFCLTNSAFANEKIDAKATKDAKAAKAQEKSGAPVKPVVQEKATTPVKPVIQEKAPAAAKPIVSEKTVVPAKPATTDKQASPESK